MLYGTSRPKIYAAAITNNSMRKRVLLKVGGAHTRGFTPRGLYAQSEHARFCGLPNIATSMSNGAPRHTC